MVAGSLLLILVSAVLLGIGMTAGHDVLVVVSLGVSAAAGALIAFMFYRQRNDELAAEVDESFPEARPAAACPTGTYSIDEPTVPMAVVFEPEPEPVPSPGLDAPAAATPAADPAPERGPSVESHSFEHSDSPVTHESVTLAESASETDAESSVTEDAKDAEPTHETQAQEEEIDIDALFQTSDGDDPPDEPAAELLLASETKRLSAMDADVSVVDGRPRFHVSGCEHLAGKASQALPVSEAVELGFTPCSLCSAATTLLV